MKQYKKKSVEPTELVLLNSEEIAARRIPVEDAELSLGKNGNWLCHYCSRRFSSEGVFMRHHCEPKRRAQELASPAGMAAYGYYREWMKLKKYSQPSSAAFMESKYYRSFMNFTQLVMDANIARPDKYVEIMVATDILPTLWCRNSAYALYLEWSDKLSDPLDQVQESIAYLMDLAEKENVELTDIFDHLGPQRVISLVRQRRLDPWFLFCSSKFGVLLKKLDSSQLTAFDQVVNSAHWSGKFQSNKQLVTDIKMIAKEMGL